MKRAYLVPLLTFWLILPSFGKEVAGVQVPDAATVQDTALVLNGAGVRTRFFVKVYVGALYLKNREQTPPGVIAAAGPKSVRLHIVHSEIAAERMTSALNDGFNANNSPAELQALASRIEQFRAMFPTLRRGDRVHLDLLSDGNTEVWVNDAKRGAIAGADFQKALLLIWLGDKPVDKNLKQALLEQ